MTEQLSFAYYQTAAGLLETGCTAQAVWILRFLTVTPEYLHQPTALSDAAAEEVRAYLAGECRSFTVPYRITGTIFQRSCRLAAQRIPYGETRSYGEIAAAVGNPRAARAVGAAMARNPLWLIVPCHRVCGADGSLTGYAGGLHLKQHLLQLEQSNREASEFL